MSEKKTSGGGVVVGLLGLLFVGLKLGGVIKWSWWWVTLPFWGGFALAGIGALLLVAATVLERR